MYLRAAIVAALAIAVSDARASKVVHDLVRLDGVWMQRHEVTIGEFRVFARATGMRTKAEADGGGFQFRGGWERMSGWTWERPYGQVAGDDEPAVHVTWHEAKAYCDWAGLRLPTDAEWVAAAYTETRPEPPPPLARGKTYPYPTGDTPDGANQKSFSGSWSLPTRSGLTGGAGHVAVKTTPAGVNGLSDMGGNVWEWVDHEVGGEKRTRGGSWWYGPAQMKADALYQKPADFPAVYIGFRCARSP
jgi:formylglycine-generating enzyme required for sulfatase activity